MLYFCHALLYSPFYDDVGVALCNLVELYHGFWGTISCVRWMAIYPESFLALWYYDYIYILIILHIFSWNICERRSYRFPLREDAMLYITFWGVNQELEHCSSYICFTNGHCYELHWPWNWSSSPILIPTGQDNTCNNHNMIATFENYFFYVILRLNLSHEFGEMHVIGQI